MGGRENWKPNCYSARVANLYFKFWEARAGALADVKKFIADPVCRTVIRGTKFRNVLDALKRSPFEFRKSQWAMELLRFHVRQSIFETYFIHLDSGKLLFWIFNFATDFSDALVMLFSKTFYFLFLISLLKSLIEHLY